MFKHSQGQLSSQALGVRVMSSIQAQVVPVGHGRIQAAPKIIWRSNPKTHNSSSKKGKSGKKGNGIVTYSADLDMLLATPGFGRIDQATITSQPLQSIFNIWSDKDKWPVNIGTWSGLVASGSVTITFPGTLVCVFAVTVAQSYSVTFNDYGSPGSVSLSGNYQVNLWNEDWAYYDELQLLPHAGTARLGYTYGPTTAGSATVAIDPSFNGKLVTVYFAYIGGNAGAVSEVKINLGGSGYALNDTGTISAGNSNANYVITSVDSNGAVTGFSMTGLGSGYSTGKNIATVTGGSQPGSGTGFTVNIISIAAATKLPLTAIKQAFEPLLGDSAVTSQPMTYDDVGGVAGANVDLGIGNLTPNFQYEVVCWGGLSPSGDCNPADILANLIMSPHGLNLTSMLQRVNSGPILGSLAGMRNYCDANGIWLSVYLDQQTSYDQILQDILDCANCVAVWSEGKLKIIPYSEVSQVGNGATFTATTAGGPVWNIMPQDFVVKDAPLKVIRTAQKDAKNILPIEFTDRSNDYSPNSVDVQEGQSLAEFGARRDNTKSLHSIMSADVARVAGGPLVRRAAQVSRTTYEGNLSPRFLLMEPMDLCTITESITGLNAQAARILKAEMQEDGSIAVTAEPYSWGANAPYSVGTQTPNPQTSYTNPDPGAVGISYIFEPVLRATGGTPQLAIAAANNNPNCGGFVVLLSTDGGASYPITLGRVGQSVMGATVTSPWPAANDPDTTNDLAVDLTASLGTLQSWPQASADQFVPLAVVDGGSGSIPYELIAYTTATLTSADKYTLKATGAGNEIRRAVYGAPTLGAGVSHAAGKTFVYLEGPLLEVALDPKWIGQTLKFKFCAVNIYGTNQQDPSTVTPVSYTVTGVAASQSGGGTYSNYSISPAQPLSQAASTYVVQMAQSTATFTPSGVKTNYNARSFSVSDPGAGNTQQYWVTVQDPALVGDTGSGTTLSAFCDSNQTRWNTAGFIRIGTIVVTHAGSVSSGGGGSSSSGLQQLTISQSPDGTRTSFSININVSVLMVFIEGQKVNSADVTFTPGTSTFALSFAPPSGAHMEAIGA